MKRPSIAWLPLVITTVFLYRVAASGQDAAQARPAELLVDEWGVTIRQNTKSGTLLRTPCR